jgi:hypothetical protein
MEAGSTINVLADRLNGDSKPGFLTKPGFFVLRPGGELPEPTPFASSTTVMGVSVPRGGALMPQNSSR